MKLRDNLTIRGNLFPGVAGIHETGVVDLVADVLVLIEGECTAEGDVHDHARRPHVDIAVPVTMGNNFWS